MDWVWFLFSFEGRINRAKYWLAGLVILCWMIFFVFLFVVLSAALGGRLVLPGATTQVGSLPPCGGGLGRGVIMMSGASHPSPQGEGSGRSRAGFNPAAAR